MKRGINRKTENVGSRLGIDTRDILDELDHSIKFSFKYIQINNKFNFNDCGVKYFFRLIRRLRTVSEMHTETFQKRILEELCNHHIDWDDPHYTEESFGLKDEEIAEDAWQFGLDRKKFGRIHGFFIDNRFYIRWFDPKHRLWPLDENKSDRGLDKDFTDIKKEQIIQNGPEWAKESIESIEKNYKKYLEEEKSLNDDLLDEMEEKYEVIEIIERVICPNCKEKLNKILEDESA